MEGISSLPGISPMIMKKPLSKGECFLDNEVAVGDKDTRHVVVRGVAEGGRNLQFTWDFSDDYEETIVKR